MRAFSVYLTVALLLLCAALVAEPVITLSVYPKIVSANPYKRTAFRVVLRIADDPNNRLYSFSGDCGAEVTATVREVDFVVKTWNVELVATQDCLFVACVHKSEKGQVKRYCITEKVSVKEE